VEETNYICNFLSRHEKVKINFHVIVYVNTKLNFYLLISAI